MKTFKQLIAEVAQPNNEDELNFKEKHSIEVIDHPASKEHQHSAEKKSPKRRADYNPGEDEEVYEAKMTSADKEDDDKPVRIKLRGWGPDQKKGNMGNPAARASLMKKEAKLDPVGKEDDDIDNDGDVDSSDEYLHARRKAISKAMKKGSDELSEISQNTLRNYMDKAGKERLSKSKEAAQHFAKAGMTGSAKDTAKGMDAARVANKRAKGYEMAFGKNLEKSMKKEASETSPYAIGMASAMKQTGDKPPLKKSTITKAHKIAKSIMKNESLDEDATLDQIRAILTKRNDGTKVIKDKSGYFHIKYKDSSHKGPYHTLKDVLKGLDESAFVAKAAAAHRDGKKKFTLGNKTFPVTIKKATADKIALESAELFENEQMAAIGRKLQKMAPKEKNDMISNAMANLGDHLESFGTPFGAKNMKELEKKTGLNADAIQALIKKAGAVKESVEQIDEMKQPFVVIDTANGNKVVAMASDEQGAKRSIASAERPPMSIKDKSTLKIVKTRKKQDIGYPLKEDAEQIDEVSKEKLKNYINAARKDMVIRYYDDSPESDKKYFNRAKGIKKALDKRGANPKAKVPATESYELSENFKAGSVKLNDGSSVILKDQDAKLMNQLFADLNSDNKKKMMKVAMTDKNGFNEILGFAREAL